MSAPANHDAASAPANHDAASAPANSDAVSVTANGVAANGATANGVAADGVDLIDEPASLAVDDSIESVVPKDVAAVLSAIRIVKGNPSDEDIAALVSVLTAAQAASAASVVDARPKELWGAPTTMHRTRSPFSPYSFAAPQS